MWKKLRYPLVNKVKKAIRLYKLLQDGDKIAIGVSGGKDSLVLLYSLYTIKKVWPINIELHSVLLDMGWDVDYQKVKDFSEKLDIPFHYVKTDIGKVVFEERNEKSPCSLCANMRRGALNNYAKSIGCNKVALGHHLDDCIETFLMSLTYEGRMGTFSPITFLDRTEITVIRPLVFVYEKDIVKIVEKYDFPVVDKSCPIDGQTKRQETKDLIKIMMKDNPLGKDRMMTAIQNKLWSDLLK